MNKNLKKEEQLIIELTRRPHELNVHLINILVNNIDKDSWNNFLIKTLGNKVQTIIVNNVNYLYKATNKNIIPQDVKKRLEIESEKCKSIVNRLKKERIRLGHIFEQNGLKVVFLKGEGYSEYIGYQDNYRYYKDLDILVLEDNLQQLDNLLTAQGYETKIALDRKKDEKDLQKYFLYGSYNVMDYQKITDDGTFFIDVHKSNKYNIYNSMDIYNDAVKIHGVYIPNKEDLLIYSCFHTFHHYGLDCDYLKFSNLPRLKAFIDIRDLLHKIIENGEKKLLVKRIRQTKASFVVNEMVKIVDLLYDENNNFAYDITGKRSLVKHNGNDGYKSSFEKRIFNPLEEKEKIEKYASTKKLEPDIPPSINVLKITEEDKWYKKNIWKNKPPYKSLKDDFWFGYYNILGYSNYNKRGAEYTIKCSYNQKHFYVKWTLKDKNCVLGQNAIYDSKQTQLYLMFTINDKLINIQVQPKDGESNGKIFLNNFQGVLQIKEINNYEMILHKRKHGLELYTKIPWKSVGIDFALMNEIHLCTNVNLYNDKFEDVCFLRNRKISGGKCIFQDF